MGNRAAARLGQHSLRVESTEGPWLFNDAPREMRVYGVDKIPEVIETLCLEAAETTEMVWQKTQEIREFTNAITPLEILKKPHETVLLSDLMRGKKGGK